MRFVLFLLLFVIPGLSQAQNSVNMAVAEMKVSGTSTLHDWEVDANDAELTVTMNAENDISSISGVNFSVLVDNLESGKSIMNSKMHKALSKGKKSTITFQGDVSWTETGKGSVSGNLTIKGETRPATFSVKIIDGKVVGSYTLNMTDFNVDPPTAMMGAVVTGEEVTISFVTSL